MHAFIAPVVSTTSIILSSNKIQNGDIVVPANAGPHGKWPLKLIESVVAASDCKSTIYNELVK